MAFKTIANLIHLRRAWFWERDQCEHSQIELLKEIVDLAQQEVPHYRQAYEGNGLKDGNDWNYDTFSSLPILTKQMVKASFPDKIVSDRVNRQSLYTIATSGTTDRVMLFHDEYKRDWDRAADLLLRTQNPYFVVTGNQITIPPDACYERCGADEHGRLATVRSKMLDLLKAGNGQRKKAARQLVSQIMRDFIWREKMLKSLGVDGTATSPDLLDEYIDSIRMIRPSLINALPQYLYVLAKHVSTKDQSVNIKAIRPSGGKFSDEMIRTVEDAFGARVRENYGTAELGTVSFDCQENRNQHLLGELFYIEFMRDGKCVSPGELGELVITDLRNRVAPLIRYAVGDIGRYFDSPCSCGYKGITFTVDGRVDETIVTPSGIAFTGTEVIDFFLSNPEIEYAKVIQKREDSFIVEVVPSLQYTKLPDSSELAKEFSRFLGYTVNLHLRTVRRLAPERSGKYKLVHSCTYDKFNGATTNE